MDYLLGRIDRERLFSIADSESKERAGRLCEARFYVAEDLLAKAKPAEARPHLEWHRSAVPGETHLRASAGPRQ